MPIIIPSSCKVHDFEHITIWFNNGVIYGKYKPDLVINLQVARDIINDRKTISESIMRPFFIDITDLLSIDKPARNYMASSEACEYLSAGAIYTDNKLLAFLGNAWIILDKPLIPSKVFTNKEAGLKWLEPFKYQN